MNNNPKRYFIDPYGCAKNQVDAEVMMSSLDAAGWQSCENPDEARLIIVNSCGFIEAAKRESINAVLQWKNQYPEKRIVLAGCLAMRYRDELAQLLPEAEILDENFFHDDSCNPGGRPLLGFPGQAYVKIAEGCNNRCAFCAIPLIRGPLRCRDVNSVTAECQSLLKREVRELCLIAQDVASYPALSDLVHKILSLPAPASFWVRLLYLHPDHFPLDLLDVFKENSTAFNAGKVSGRLLPYFDIPFQHGSAAILRAMNRRGDAQSYLRLIGKIRSCCKIENRAAGAFDAAIIRSTFLTGFPGETEEDFAALLDFQQKARFDWLGVFTYSREEGTAAFSLKNRIPKKTAAARKSLIEEKQIPITEERMNRFAGMPLNVLVEEEIAADGGKNEPLWLGRLYCQAPEVDGAAVIHSRSSLKPGALLPARVLRRAGFDLEVEV